MVKPVGHVPEHEWVCAVYASWTDEGVLVPRPLRPRSDDGSWSVDGLMGWGAHILVPRRNARVETQLDVIAEASDKFHAAVASLPRPAFVDARDDPWAFGDRLAWEDAAPLGDPETLEVIDRLRTALAPVTNCLRQLIAYRAFCRADVSATPVAAPRVSD